MRFGGGPLLQPGYVVFFVLFLILALRNDQPGLLVIPAVALVLWALGATAFVRVDDEGIHRRCYLPRTDHWADISQVELYALPLNVRSVRRMIRVHHAHGRHWLAPAAGNTRATEDFARQLVGAARARGIDVDTSGWGGFEA